MRLSPSYIWQVWESAGQGGVLAGEFAPNGRVTVQPGGPGNPLFLFEDYGVYSEKVPLRYWLFGGLNLEERGETDVPNIKNASINRTVDADAQECTIELDNTWMNPNTVPDAPFELGNPGYFTPFRGAAAADTGRWPNHIANAWSQILVPNAVLRTYEGFGGHDKTTLECVNDGNLVMTGVWLIDDVEINASGRMIFKCRDMAKLLVDQPIFPPVVPSAFYPLIYCRYKPTDTVTATGGGTNDSSGDSPGHPKEDAFENNADTFWLSGPFGSKTDAAWIEFNNIGVCDKVVFKAWAGQYQCFVSVFADGAWQGAGAVPGSGIAYVTQGGVPTEQNVSFALGASYDATLIRLTFTNLYSGDGAAPFFAGVREYEAERTVEGSGPAVDGNYLDYSDIIKDLVLWAGFQLGGESLPTVYGNIESTGAFSSQCLDPGIFDKQPIIDPIKQIREIVGYLSWVDEEGGFRFESPNWWEPGNVLITGERVSFIPDIDERVQLTAYSVRLSDKSARTEIIIATEDPTPPNFETTFVTRETNPPGEVFLRGIQKPAMWINHVFTNDAERSYMARLIGTHIQFALRRGSVEMLGNPCIGINDQVRIWERVSSEVYIHYVRGYTSNHDFENRVYKMNLDTHWLGEEGAWAIEGGRPDYPTS